LKHIFTGKFVHMSTTHTSKNDKNNMKVSLVEFNAKNAQFFVLPRYKVKSEGEVVQLYDQIVFESVKSPGHYFHASECCQIDHFSTGSELNLGVERSTFTLIGSYRDRPERGRFVRIRIRHLLTRQYLGMDVNMQVTLTPDSTDPRTVFRLHSVLKERDEILPESYARIEHMLSGCWLHALKDEDYEKRQYHSTDTEATMQDLQWDGAPLRKISASKESMYDDAYTLQIVEEKEVLAFNFVAGMVPFLFNLIKDQHSNAPFTARKTHAIIATLRELKEYIMPEGVPDKDRQKLLRNLRVIDLLVKLLQCPLRSESDEQHQVIRIFKEAYDVLHAYMLGKSRKNALYIAKYIDFFQTQFTQKGGIGLNVAQMIVELVRDKRKIVDRITQQHIETFIQLLRHNPSYHFLDLLQVLCVCDGVAIPNNQTYIVEQWLRTYRDSVYLMDRGQNINKRPNIVYISTDGGEEWTALHQFVDTESMEYDAEKNQFLIHQLDLMKAFCFGRNDFAIHTITREFGYITWEDAFLCIQCELLPDVIRAKFTELIIGLFVDVGNNYSVLDHPNICFVWEYVGSKDQDRDQSQYVVKDLVTIFPVLRDWLAEFLAQNCTMTATMAGRNMLIVQVLSLLQYLVKFGYYMDLEDVRMLLPPLLSLLDGRHDVPFLRDKVRGYSKDAVKFIQTYRTSGRFERSEETEAIVNAKFQAMEALDLLLTFQRNLRLTVFVTMFKQAEQGTSSKRNQPLLEPLLYSSYNADDPSKKALKKQKEIMKILREMFDVSSILDMDSTTLILMDLCKYKYDQMVVKSLDILIKLYSSQMDMFQLAGHAQVLLTHDSARVHREVQRSLPTLRRLARSKLNDQQVALITDVLDELCEFCHLPKTEMEPHPMNQNIMISHGILNIVMDILSQEIDSTLLVIFKDNQSICLKVQPRQVQRIVMLAAECQDTAPQFLDLLKTLVKVESLDLTIKRNQALVMKYVMQTFKKSAYVLDQPQEKREKILRNESDPGHLTYFINLVELLATCAEGDNKFIESLCQTILPVEDILATLTQPGVDANLKRPFIKFLLWVYMKTSGGHLDTAASDLPHHKLVWDFIRSASDQLEEWADFIGQHASKVTSMLKNPPDIRLVF
ncbi:inositol 1,4,5-trisphosphate receptor type 1, partial [Elysia marginata]